MLYGYSRRWRVRSCGHARVTSRQACAACATARARALRVLSRVLKPRPPRPLAARGAARELRHRWPSPPTPAPLFFKAVPRARPRWWRVWRQPNRRHTARPAAGAGRWHAPARSDVPPGWCGVCKGGQQQQRRSRRSRCSRLPHGALLRRRDARPQRNGTPGARGHCHGRAVKATGAAVTTARLSSQALTIAPMRTPTSSARSPRPPA